MENLDTAKPNPEEDLKQGLAYLTGVGQSKDEAMAAACFLNAFDRGSPDGAVAAAIVYYCGIGVTRDTQQATEYANIYLVKEPNGAHARSMHEIVDMSLGSENARKILMALGGSKSSIVNAPQQVPKNVGPDQRSTDNKKVLIFAGSGVLSIGVILAVLFGGATIGTAGLGKPAPLEKLFTTEELKASKEEAQSFAGLVRNEARQSAR
jgi:hypothetical protein